MASVASVAGWIAKGWSALGAGGQAAVGAAAGKVAADKMTGGDDIKFEGGPKTAPVPDDRTRDRAKEREMQRRYAGAGRSGTVLSSNNNLG